MDNSINILINKIISILSPLRQSYPDEINEVTNDLINYKFDSLNKFLATYYKDINYSSEIKEFVTSLVNSGLLDASYLERIQDNKNYEFIPFKESSILKVATKPLNVKEFVLNSIKNNTPTPELEIVNHEYMEIKFDEPQEEIVKPKEEKPTHPTEPKEETTYTKEDIDALRNKIIEAQLNYLNNANNFIKSLEKVDDKTLYDSLVELNDIRFIQHSLSKLSHEALERLLVYVENKLELNKHSSIDMFIIESIKKYLHTKMH